MNTKDYKNIEEKVTGNMSSSISNVLDKFKDNSKKETKDGVNLLDITKKLSSKKFGEKK